MARGWRETSRLAWKTFSGRCEKVATLVVTDLFLSASALPTAALTAAVPPACRRGVTPPPELRVDGEDLVLDLPDWSPRRPARHLVPSLAALTPEQFSFRFELAVLSDGAWSDWAATTSIGRDAFPPMPSHVHGLDADIDQFTTSEPAESVRVRVRMRTGPDRFVATPWLVALSACDLAPIEAEEEEAPGKDIALTVPPDSQMEQTVHLRRRICSPTSLAMVLAYWGAKVEVAALADAMHHPGLDLYGVWPAAIRAAGCYGVAGYLLRFPGWSAAAWCLERGIPIIASVRYTEGELSGAAIAATEGHLLVLTGREGDDVLVNDPAAPTRGEVSRRYPLDEIRSVWLERSGVGYVLFRTV